MAQISLAGWSLHRWFRREEDPLLLLDFPRVAREMFHIGLIELNSPFFESHDTKYLNRLIEAAESQGVKMLNIAVDGQGDLSSQDRDDRRKAIERHLPWFDTAAYLGCSAIRANTGGHGQEINQSLLDVCAESYARLAEEGAERGVKILIENHWGLSENPDNIVYIMEQVDSEWLGTLPDFGNFPEEVRFEGLGKIAPYAHAVHAKMYEFDASGEDPRIDVGRCVQIIRDAGYDGTFGIEFEGEGDEIDGVRRSRDLLERHLSG